MYEAPNRAAATLGDLAAACGGDRPAAACRELTKLHEQVVRGTLDSVAASFASGAVPTRGELVIVVGPIDAQEAAEAAAGTPALETALEAVDGLVAGGLSRAEAARRVSAETRIPRRRLYRPPAD
jgi:16S rRNA (cytidine1402-2'-O)-methyltransferase